MRYTVTAILAALLIVTAGCSSTGSTPATNTATSQPATTTTGTTIVQPTTTAAKPTHPDGHALIQAIKDQGGANPMLAPLVDGEYKGGFLVVTYQESDKDLAQSVCSYIHNGTPPGFPTDATKDVQVIGPTGKVLAMTDPKAGGFCRTK